MRKLFMIYDLYYSPQTCSLYKIIAMLHFKAIPNFIHKDENTVLFYYDQLGEKYLMKTINTFLIYQNNSIDV